MADSLQWPTNGYHMVCMILGEQKVDGLVDDCLLDEQKADGLGDACVLDEQKAECLVNDHQTAECLRYDKKANGYVDHNNTAQCLVNDHPITHCLGNAYMINYESLCNKESFFHVGSHQNRASSFSIDYKLCYKMCDRGNKIFEALLHF